jgi:lysophospholipase L1-like esterase
MNIRGHVARTVALIAAVLAGAVSVSPRPAVAATPTSAVSLGDSYISGEAGRWQGNSIDPLAGRDGTDRAFTGTGYDLSRVYQPPSDTNGCHRSDVAEIRSAALRVDRRVNIACSGAVTQNIFRASSGGQGQNGELPQADQLAQVARQTRVKLVVLSIGGNDLGFSSIVSACLQAYETFGPPCQPSQQAAIDAKFPTAMANVGKAIDEIRAAMQSAGYPPSAYRFVLQSYPSALPRGSEIRVPEIDHNARTNIDGCPVYNSDATWARDSVVSQIATGLKSVAASRGVQFLDLRDLLQGREMCSVSTRLADPTHPPSATTSDWVRFLNLSAVDTQGQQQETFHPNAYAQQAFGKCLSLLYAQRGNAACDNTPGAGPNAVVTKPIR